VSAADGLGRALKAGTRRADERHMEIALTGVLGAVVGSFLNVVSFRLPRHESVVRPGSRCPACATPIKPYDTVPVLSWIMLRGRCRSCGASISPRYPLVEALTAALCVAVVLTRSSAAGIALGIALVFVVVPAAAADLMSLVIPNQIVAAGAALALLLGSILDPGGEPGRLIAGAAAGGGLLAIVLAYPRGMGMGDVKLAAVIGLFLGLSVLPALLIAIVSGSLVGAVVIARKGVRVGRKTALPFGVFLALGALVALFAGHPLIHWYSQQFIH
jgi:leader peptidase (prepilin peptidase) / N-methyltransferase